MLVAIYLALLVAGFYWQVKLVLASKITKGKAIGLYLAYTIAPIILYVAVFLILVGIEELTGTAIIGEGYARTLALVVAGGLCVALLATLIFSLVVIVMKIQNVDAT